MDRAALAQAFRYALLVLLVLAVAVLLVSGGIQYLPRAHDVPAEMRHLPAYAGWSFLRMLVAYGLSLVFSVTYGFYAATNQRASRVMMPLLDILQSVPVVTFFPAATIFFVNATHGSRLGAEMASVMLIFTSQAWNMAFGVYEGITTIPQDSFDALASQGVRGFGKFRKLYMPACVPKLVYNSIMSWAGGWFALILCEIISGGGQTIPLPGLGTFLTRASEKGDNVSLFAGVMTLIAIVVAMHFLIWRPLESWSEKFRYEFSASTVMPSRMLKFWRELFLLKLARTGYQRLSQNIRTLYSRLVPQPQVVRDLEAPPPLWRRIAARIVGAAAALAGLYILARAIYAISVILRPPWPAEAKWIPLALGASFLRMVVAYAITLAWTIPVAVWAGSRDRVMRVVGPFAQIAASVPAPTLFPVMVMLVIRHAGGLNVATVLLLLMGMQWYMLFNLLAGVHAIPGDLKEAARSLGLSTWKSFRALTLPAIIPSIITGSITGWGGGWNALIVAEYQTYKGHLYKVLGIGALLDEATYETHSTAMLLLGVTALITVIVLINRFFWRNLYTRAADRFKIEY